MTEFVASVLEHLAFLLEHHLFAARNLVAVVNQKNFHHATARLDEPVSRCTMSPLFK